MSAEEKLSSILVNFEYYSAKQAIDEIIDIVGCDDLIEYVSSRKGDEQFDTGFHTWYEDGEECSLGCKSHMTHPCERCGRIGAMGKSKIMKYFL
jgi:hypothetical protein